MVLLLARMHTHTSTHRHAHPPMYILDMYYIQKQVGESSLSGTNIIAKCYSPILTGKTYSYALTQKLPSDTCNLNPQTMIKWTYMAQRYI